MNNTINLREELITFLRLSDPTLSDLCIRFKSFNLLIYFAGESARDIIIKNKPTKIELITVASINQIKAAFADDKSVKIEKCSSNATISYGAGPIKQSYNIALINSSITGAFHLGVYGYRMVFTMHHLFVALNGTLHDEKGGYDDLINKRVILMSGKENAMLISDPLLVIFKYFELLAAYGDCKSPHSETLNAITSQFKALRNVQGDVIWYKVKQILMSSNRIGIMELFFHCGGAEVMGLPAVTDLSLFREVSIHPLNAISYMCSVMHDVEDVRKFSQRAQLTKYELDLAVFIVQQKENAKRQENVSYFVDIMKSTIQPNQARTEDFILELLKFLNKKRTFYEFLKISKMSKS